MLGFLLPLLLFGCVSIHIVKTEIFFEILSPPYGEILIIAWVLVNVVYLMSFSAGSIARKILALVAPFGIFLGSYLLAMDVRLDESWRFPDGLAVLAVGSIAYLFIIFSEKQESKCFI